MKTFFAVLGIIFLVLIVAVGAGIGALALRGNPLDAINFWLLSTRGKTLNQESKAYADAAIPAIVGSWNEQEVLNRQSPEFMQAVTKQQLDQLFQRISTLGHLQKCEPSQGQSILSATTRSIKAQYTANATFDKGPAMIQLDLIKHGDQWQILSFFIRAPALEQQQQQQKPAQPQQPPAQQQPH